MEQMTLIIGIVAVVSWTLGFGFVYACVVIVVLAIIQQIAESLQRPSTSSTVPMTPLPTLAKQRWGQRSPWQVA